jgi:hypothetical protein
MDDVRLLDLALRGPRPAAGLAGIDAHLADQAGADVRGGEFDQALSSSTH